ncbi:putative vacuolar protein sorting-associated protein Ist1 [Helianthus annuus]|nr:putative vacuolar protein sorting-associated protein Ist1 [Helianthus annuus]
MFDGFLKSKFYSRCKSEIKLTMKRIEMIRRKRNAMQKFLRNDVADLIKTGLDSNAFNRVEQLYADQNLSWCYEYVEQCCLLVLSELSAMNKQRECPEQCKEAISTLMFAAAIFSDLPELRELRTLFAERYANHLEPYANQQFVTNLKAAPPAKHTKLQMMQEIALEYDLNWDSKVLEQKLYKPPPFVNESVKTRRQTDLETNMKKETAEEKHKKPTTGKNPPYKSRAETETGTKKEEKHDHGRLSPCWSSNGSSSSESATSADDSASEDVPQGRKFNEYKSMAPPYIITESTKKSTDTNGLRSMGPPYTKPDLSKKTAVNDDISKQIPRSMRIRKPLKQAVGSSRGDNGVEKTSSTIPNGENKFVDEEKKMDKLLSHYSRKPSHVPAPKRSGSLPSEPVAAGGVVDERKGLSRAVTYQPDSRSHVHPKLPDYDDFVARLAAFRASS